MATSATGSPTPNGIPTIAPSVDAPDGVGINSIVTAVDTLITSALKTVFKKTGTTIATRRALNLIEGSNMTITVADDGANDKVDVTLAATVPSISPSIANGIGVLSSMPSAAAVGSGFTYFATDQMVEYISNGSTWFRKGNPAGHTTDWFSASVPTGWVAYDGTALPSSTGIYADLFAHLGTTTTPDTRGRSVVSRGTHADVSSIGANDGGAVAARRPKHAHSKVVTQPTFTGTAGTTGNDSPDHTHHPASSTYFSGTNDGGGQQYLGTTGGQVIGINSLATAGADVRHQHSFTPAGTISGANVTVGPQTGAELIDTSGYIVALKIAKL